MAASCKVNDRKHLLESDTTLVLEGEQFPSGSWCELPSVDKLQDFIGKRQQAQVIGNAGAVDPGHLSHLFLRDPGQLKHPFPGSNLLHLGKIDPFGVLQKRNCGHLRVVVLPHLNENPLVRPSTIPCIN